MKEETTDRPFVYRPYRKAELAQLYMPNESPQTATRRFNSWLRFSPLLWGRLQAADFTMTARKLTYEQVKIIVDYLGVP